MVAFSSEYWVDNLQNSKELWPTSVDLITYCKDLPIDLEDFEDRLDSICKFLPFYRPKYDVELRYGQNVSIQLTHLSDDTLHISVLDNNLYNGIQSERCAFILKKSTVGVWHVSPEQLHSSRLKYPTADKQTNQNIAAVSCQQAFRRDVVPAILYEKILFQRLEATRNDQKMEAQNAAASAAVVEARKQQGSTAQMKDLIDFLRKRFKELRRNGLKKS